MWRVMLAPGALPLDGLAPPGAFDIELEDGRVVHETIHGGECRSRLVARQATLKDSPNHMLTKVK